MGYIKSDDEFRVLAEPVFERVRRDLAGEHDSATCRADEGQPCPQCQWANEQERREQVSRQVAGFISDLHFNHWQKQLSTGKAGEHDSQTCDAANGKPCEMCVAADEHEAREAVGCN